MYEKGLSESLSMDMDSNSYLLKESVFKEEKKLSNHLSGIRQKRLGRKLGCLTFTVSYSSKIR